MAPEDNAQIPPPILIQEDPITDVPHSDSPAPAGRDILSLLARYHVLTASLVAKLSCTSEAVARRNLRRHVRPRLVSSSPLPTTSSGRPQNIHNITRRGFQNLPPEFQDEEYRPPRITTSSPFVRHCLLTNEILASMSIACRDARYSCHFLTESEARAATQRVHAGNAELLPDAVIALSNAAGKSALFFLEVDRGTESLTVLRRKVELYSTWHVGNTFFRPTFATATRGFRVLFVLPNATRLEQLLQLTAAEPEPRIFWCTTLDQARAAAVLGPVWRVSGCEDRCPLVRSARPKGDPKPDREWTGPA